MIAVLTWILVVSATPGLTYVGVDAKEFATRQECYNFAQERTKSMLSHDPTANDLHWWCIEHEPPEPPMIIHDIEREPK